LPDSGGRGEFLAAPPGRWGLTSSPGASSDAGHERKQLASRKNRGVRTRGTVTSHNLSQPIPSHHQGSGARGGANRRV
jgi:hypothetical protein